MTAMKKATKSAFSSFLQRANTPAAEEAAAPDPARRLLGALAAGPLSPADLAERANLAPQALIEALRPLEDLRLLRRLPEGADGQVCFELTPSGRDLLAKTARA